MIESEIIIPGAGIKLSDAGVHYTVEYDPDWEMYNIGIEGEFKPLKTRFEIIERCFPQYKREPVEIPESTSTYEDLVDLGLVDVGSPDRYKDYHINNGRHGLEIVKIGDYFYFPHEFNFGIDSRNEREYPWVLKGGKFFMCIPDDCETVRVFSYRITNDVSRELRVRFVDVALNGITNSLDINPDLFKFVPDGFGIAGADYVSRYNSVYFKNKKGEICRISDHFLPFGAKYPANTLYNIIIKQ